ncbi:unnamed protein product [Oppiella nova]|uniref:RRM domain-containing protein n=1 Tax=Oppiella nova TaxID=334625 RepID=A0A7R9LGJ4_9ACAR|nr:unnamed protein product [Oppiella nova]CAG2163454.1 unnamed protein product [Oppiella nova]
MFGYCFVGFDAIKSAIHGQFVYLRFGDNLAWQRQLKRYRFFAKDDRKPKDEVTVKEEPEDYSKSDDEDMKDEDEEENEDMSDGYGSDGSDESVKNKKMSAELIKKMNDASEERTIFVRNVSFGTSAESLNEMMKRFGETLFCKLCVDAYSEHSKGTRKHFIFLFSLRLFTNLRRFVLLLSLKNNLPSVDLQSERNLYLAKEGLIYPDSPAAEGVSQTDLAKRLTLETRKRKTLQNTHYFVSDTRLCVHNIPLNCDNKQLRDIFMNAVNDKNARITEARVMLDRLKNDNKFGKSKGFGFIEFAEHIHALKALRQLNNNPDIFTPQKRPIVEFSVENKVALNKKRHRIERDKNGKGGDRQNGKGGDRQNGKGGDRQNRKGGDRQNGKNPDQSNQDLAEQSVKYSGVMSRPNKLNEKIFWGFHLFFNPLYVFVNKKKDFETQDAHDLHFKKRKNIFRDNEDKRAVPMPVKKKVKWFAQ